MSAYSQLLRDEFPDLDSDYIEYLSGLIETEKDCFAESSDVYELIGPVLSGIRPDKKEDDILALCNKLADVILGGKISGVSTRTLSAPIFLGEMVDEYSVDDFPLKSSDMQPWRPVAVDQKKLAKAEEKIKQKQDKRSAADSNAPAVIPSRENDSATASQMISRKDTEKTESRAPDIRIENFDISFGSKRLVEEGLLVLSYGRRFGLVGRNGTGKTTLLKCISSGSLKFSNKVSILHVEQEVVGDETEALQSVLECDTVREGLLTRERQLVASSQESSNDPMVTAELQRVYQELQAMESEKAPSRAGSILNGLGFSHAMQKAKTRELSGGWRMRLALARALFTKPDLLLLDEPTNMLDLKAILWLEDYLQEWPTTLLVVSHDRKFLNQVTTDILHLHSKRISTYRGDFETFMKTREDQLKQQQREYEAQKEYREHIQIFIDRFRYNANRASQVQSKLKMLEKLPKLQEVEKDGEIVFKFAEPDHVLATLLRLDEVSFGYEKDRMLFDNVNLSANMGSRICIVGENGSGKTTLLKILLGDFEPTKGLRHTHGALRIGYFSQHFVDQLEMNMNGVEYLHSKMPGRQSEYYRSVLGQFGITGDLALQSVGTLSGGQKSRVVFSNLAMQVPNLLLLDEPTNHLDMESIEAMGNAINEYPGAVILVSHDERLIEVVAKELWLCKNGRVQSIEGGIKEYHRMMKEELEISRI